LGMKSTFGIRWVLKVRSDANRISYRSADDKGCLLAGARVETLESHARR